MTKKELFDLTNGGLAIFEALIPEVAAPGYKKGKKFMSPFRDEKTPSANIMPAGDIYIYHDFGTGENLNAIEFVMQLKHLDFKEALAECSKLSNLTFIERTPRPIIELKELRPSDGRVRKVMEIQNTGLHKYCTEVLHMDPDHLIKWGVGGYKKTKDGVETIYTSFVFRNQKGEGVNIKHVPYNAETGKRNKELGFFSLKSDKEEEIYRFCLFGAHLVNAEAGDRPLVIVESEKTAVIASYRKYRDFDFVASRGGAGAGLAEVEALGLNPDKPIIILCDADVPRKVPRMFKELEAAGMNVHLVDLYPNRQDKTDLADYIHERLTPQISFPPTMVTTNQVTGQTRYTSSKPDWATQTNQGRKLTPRERRELYKKEIELTPIITNPDGSVSEREYPLHHYIQDAAYTDTYDPQRALYDSGCYAYLNQLWVIKDDKPVSISNFTIQIMQELHERDRVVRLCKLTNKQGIIRTVEMTGKELISLQGFKTFCYDQGNFEFSGQQEQLDKLRAYVSNLASRSTTIDILGWVNKGRFFALANGIIKDGQFYEASSEGLVISDSFSYYIRFGNETNENVDQQYSNERRVWFNNQPNKGFAEWSRLHHQVYKSHGMVAQVFAIMALFSDFIFKQRNSVPVLFLYGSASSGKGSLAKSVQQLFGVPQEALDLAGKASTAKAMVRKLANFCNLAMLLEEFTPTEENNNFLKSIWDRMGYERANKDMGFGSNVVPISSAAMVTSNNYPVDEPVVQRLIIREMHENERTEQARDLYEALKQFETGNLTTFLPMLLQMRDLVEQKYLQLFLKWEKRISKEWKTRLPADRMYSNAACLLAMCEIITEHIKDLSYTVDDLNTDLEASLTQQAGKLIGGGEVASFFETIQYAINTAEILKGRQYGTKGTILLLQPSQCGAAYNKLCKMATGTSPLGKATLFDKLCKDRSYVGTYTSIRGDGDGFKSSAMGFDMTKMDCDMERTIDIVMNGLDLPSLGDKAEQKVSQEKGSYKPAKVPVKRDSTIDTMPDTPF